MTRSRILHSLALLLCLTAAACSSSTPAPTPVFTFAFAGETTTPAANTFWIDKGSDSSGVVGLRLNAHFTLSFSVMDANILFDKAVLTPTDFTTGDFLKQGGALVTANVVTFPAGSNNLYIHIERPDSFAPATGDGVLLTLHFKAATGAVKGSSSAIQWNDSHAYLSGFSNDRLVRTYGGTVTVQ